MLHSVKMDDLISVEKPILDFESILESYALEEENVEDILQRGDQLISLWHEKRNNLIRLQQENEEKKKYLRDLQISNKQLMQKINCISNNFMTLNDCIKTAQESNNLSLNEEYKLLDDFGNKAAHTAGSLKTLLSEFEQNTLVDQIRNVSSELLLSREKEDQFGNLFKKIKMNQKDVLYKRSQTFKVILNQYKVIPNIDESIKNLKKTEKNMQFLKEEIERQNKVLAMLD